MNCKSINFWFNQIIKSNAFECKNKEWVVEGTCGFLQKSSKDIFYKIVFKVKYENTHFWFQELDTDLN